MEVSRYKSFFRSLLAVVLLLQLLPATFGQTPLSETREEKAKRGEALFHQASDLFKAQTPESLAAASAKFGEARIIFRELGDKEREGFCLTWLGGTSARLGNKQAAIDHFIEALKVYEELADKTAVAEVHLSLANVYSEFKDPARSVEHFQSALRLFSALGQKTDEIDTLRIIGKVYADQADWPNARSFNEKSLSLARSIGDPKREAQALANLGLLHLIEKSFKPAIARFEEMLALARSRKDRTIEAEALGLIATAYRRQNDFQKMLEVLDKSLVLSREMGDKMAEAKALNSMAEISLQLGQPDAALKFADEALKVSVAASDKAGEGSSLLYIGIARGRNRELETALETLNRATTLLRSTRNVEGLALARTVIGGIYLEQGNIKQALEASLDALQLSRMGGLKEIEVEVTNNIGGALFLMGEYKKSREYYDLALPIARELGLTQTEARIQTNIGDVLRVSGANPEALERFQQAQKIFDALGDKISSIKCQIAMGGIYLDLGENKIAHDYYQPVLTSIIEALESANTKEMHSMYRDLGATVMNNLGKVYSEMGELALADAYFTKSLKFLRDLNDKNREAITLSNLASVQASRGEIEKSKETLRLALQLIRETGNIGQEATILNSIAAFASETGDRQNAIDNYGRSLFLLKYIEDPRRESITLANLQTAYALAKNHRAAIFYGKLAINKLQSLRSLIRTLDRQNQKTYLSKIEVTYRALAELLIKEGRASEAQEVLNSFKDQQYFDTDASTAEAGLLTLTPTERELSARLDDEAKMRKKNAASTDVIADGAALRTESDDFVKVIKQIETQMEPDQASKQLETPDTTSMIAMLGNIEKETRQKTVAVYTLIDVHAFYALIVAEGHIRVISVPTKGAAINIAARKFWALLQTDKYDPTGVGKELYDLVFKPIERELPLDTKTILWSLDGNLRYIPMAALFDGKQYLVERYDHVMFTRADAERLGRSVSPKWTATALGSSKAHVVDVLGNAVSFSSLPGVGAELDTIFGGAGRRRVLAGETLLDSAFTRKSMLSSLKNKRPVVHIASHFSFRPGDEARSFLLMGDGTAFTLADMKAEKDMFAGVELLTLSACNTAAQQAGADGREVDAFFELAQRLGANSVMATLWPVADNSTPWLMREFYNLKVNGKRNKADALRNAQLALLKGSANASRSTVRTNASSVNIVVAEDELRPTADGATPTRNADALVIGKKDAKPYKADPKKPFAHPFFWSPFVLIGNWR